MRGPEADSKVRETRLVLWTVHLVQILFFVVITVRLINSVAVAVDLVTLVVAIPMSLALQSIVAQEDRNAEIILLKKFRYISLVQLAAVPLIVANYVIDTRSIDRIRNVNSRLPEPPDSN